ncbi:MAG: alpha-L-arabinofuranosidase C-terminal domain-containing protein [Fimbriimonadaceae bacterium]
MTAALFIASLALGPSAPMDDNTIKVLPTPLCAGRINPMQCGQFMEYLCTLFPGMWAEKLSDGNFEGLTPYKFEFIKETDFREKPWYPSGAVNRGEYALDHDRPVNGETCQRITVTDGPPATVGLSQDGVAVEPTDPCRLSLWLRSTGLTAKVHVYLHDGGRVLCDAWFAPTKEWRKFTAKLKPKTAATNATFTVDVRGPGTLWIDAASLMPSITVGGWRPDVVAALRKLQPHIIRIGGSVMDDPNLGDFQWTDTIGDPDFRKPFRAWGGLQPTGPGMEEFVQLCRAVGAEPLICVRFRARTPKDAADEIEYFNGASDTKMGALRAKNGHPKPYAVKYWQIGNERWGEDYWSQVPAFCKAMKAVDPTIKLMSSFPSEELLKRAGQYLDYVCPHHYECDNLTAENDDFTHLREMLATLAPGRHIKLGVTEWNTTAGDWGLKRATLWTLENALACARYQNLMHRNCDIVEIANRSNLTNSFCSGILQTDNRRLYLTPTYYAQMLYSNLAGAKPLQIEPPAPLKAGLDVSATVSDDGATLTLFCVNDSADTVHKILDFSSLGGTWLPLAKRWVLGDTLGSDEPDVANSFDHPTRVDIKRGRVAFQGDSIARSFAPLTLTVLRFERPPRRNPSRASGA